MLYPTDWFALVCKFSAFPCAVVIIYPCSFISAGNSDNMVNQQD